MFFLWSWLSLKQFLFMKCRDLSYFEVYNNFCKRLANMTSIDQLAVTLFLYRNWRKYSFYWNVTSVGIWTLDLLDARQRPYHWANWYRYVISDLFEAISLSHDIHPMIQLLHAYLRCPLYTPFLPLGIDIISCHWILSINQHQSNIVSYIAIQYTMSMSIYQLNWQTNW